MIIITKHWLDHAAEEIVVRAHGWPHEIRFPMGIFLEPANVPRYILAVMAEAYVNAERRKLAHEATIASMIPAGRHEARNFKGRAA